MKTMMELEKVDKWMLIVRIFREFTYKSNSISTTFLSISKLK